MNNTVKSLYDGLDTRDQLNRRHSAFDTSIDVRNSETGEYIFKGLRNKVILPGSGLIAHKLFDIFNSDDTAKPEEEITVSYDKAMASIMKYTGSETAHDEEDTVANANNHKVLLFCCGTDGCNGESFTVNPVSYKMWTKPEALVPFRCSTDDIDSSLRDTYFGRCEQTIGSKNYKTYYFKKFDQAPVLKQQYVNGDEITSYDYSDATEQEVETFVELSLKITKEDIREYFIATTGIEGAKINTISLCSAYPVKGSDGYTYYKDIRPLTKLNFPSESLIDTSKGIDIIYHIYM